MISYDEAKMERKKALHNAWMEGRKAAENDEPRKADYADRGMVEAFGAGYDSYKKDN